MVIWLRLRGTAMVSSSGGWAPPCASRGHDRQCPRQLWRRWDRGGVRRGGTHRASRALQRVLDLLAAGSDLRKLQSLRGARPLPWIHAQ